jgi:hypothetical protein
MKKLLLGTTILVGLAGPVFAASLNTIAIDATGNGGNSAVQSLSIIQDDITSTNTVSGNGSSSSSATQLPVRGTWNSISISQAGGNNTLKGAIKTSTSLSSTASLNANYVTTSTGANTHSLTIGGTAAPANPSVTIFVKNNGSAANTVTDTLDGASLSYDLGLQGTGNTVTNNVSAGVGGITLTQGGSTYGISSNYGIAGDGNTVSNALSSAGGTVFAALMVNGDTNSVTNTVTTSGGAITLTQGGAGYGITGGGNSVTNTIGQSVAVNSFTQHLAVNGSGNTIVSTVDSAGAKVVDLSLLASSSNNTVNTSVTGGGAQTANLSTSGSSYVDYGLTSAANGSYANVSLNSVTGVSGTPAVVRVEQTLNAPGATATLTVNGGGNTMGVLASVPGTTYASSGAGVSVYQNSASAYLNATVTAAGNGYTAKFAQ